MKYRFIEEHREANKIKRMCEVLKVSRSGYYAWETREPSLRQRGNEELLRQIREGKPMNSSRLYPCIAAAAKLASTMRWVAES